MKIAILTSGFLPIPAVKGGAVETLIDLLIEQNEIEKKIDIEVISIFDENAYKKSLKYKKTKIHYLKMNSIIKMVDIGIYKFINVFFQKKNSSKFRFILQRFYFQYKASCILKKENYDLIILENHVTQYLALKWNNNYKKYKNKYIYHCHNEINSLYGCSKIINKTAKFLAISNFISQALQDKFPTYSQNKISVLKNCIDLRKFEKKIEVESVKKQYNISLDKKIIVFVGRLVEEKGILQLIDSLNYITTDNVQIVIVGDVVSQIKIETPFTKIIKQRCERFEGKIKCVGYISNDDIVKMYKIADVVILPSIWQEPAGLVMLEAVASKVPLITTNVGGVREYISDNVAVILENDNKLSENIAKSVEKIFNKEFDFKFIKEDYDYILEYDAKSYFNKFYELIKEYE